MADALAVVTVGNSEWLLANTTPSFCSRASVGASVGFTDRGRRPSATNTITLRGAPRASPARAVRASARSQAAVRSIMDADDTARVTAGTAGNCDDRATTALGVPGY